jgi:hypothetical protein
MFFLLLASGPKRRFASALVLFFKSGLRLRRSRGVGAAVSRQRGCRGRLAGRVVEELEEVGIRPQQEAGVVALQPFS